MFLRVTFYTLLLLCSCNNNKFEQQKETAKDSIIIQRKEPVYFPGKFVRIEKINERSYSLYLKNEEDSLVKFITSIPVNSNEISFLKDSTVNIQLNYEDIFNAAKGEYEKHVRTMVFVYDFQKK